MKSSESLSIIASRLFKENICTTPLDARSLDLIDQYMSYYKSESDLCRRLSDVELNYVQISSEAYEACVSVERSRTDMLQCLRRLTDEWRSYEFLTDYWFEINTDTCTKIQNSYSNSIEGIRRIMKTMSDELLLISETVAQIRACAASFTEVFKESKLAIYAYTLNRNVDSVLNCRSTYLQAHASARECERTSACLLGITRACTKMISCMNNMILETTRWLGLDENRSVLNSFSASNANSAICSAITLLEQTAIDYNDLTKY